jgi:hypothetical protein
LNENQIIVITGQRGCGKTTYIKESIRQHNRVLIFDLLGEFNPNAYTLADVLSLLDKNKNANFFTLGYFNPKNSEEDFAVVCKAVNRLHDVMFVVDELDFFCSATFCPKEFSEIIKRGRHQSLGVIVATRRPHEVPRLVTSQVTELITFRHVEPRDLDYLKDVANVPEEAIQKLPDFHYLRWHRGEISHGEVSKPAGNQKLTTMLRGPKTSRKDEMGLEDFFFEGIEDEPRP